MVSIAIIQIKAHTKGGVIFMSKNVNFKDLSNQKFGYLTAISIDETKTNSNHTYWNCKCICGNFRSLQTYQLTSGKVTSCGCKNPHRRKNSLISNHKRMYSVYSTMIARCHNPNSISYKYYGAKNIFVCDEWKNDFSTFVEWADNNGYNDSLSIDRIDNTKGYSPDNCRWIPLADQSKNKTTSVSYTHNGETHNMKEWCAILHFDYALAKSRRKTAKIKHIEPTFEYVFSAPKFTKKKKL
jgi:hypothetical protein